MITAAVYERMIAKCDHDIRPVTPGLIRAQVHEQIPSGTTRPCIAVRRTMEDFCDLLAAEEPARQSDFS